MNDIEKRRNENDGIPGIASILRKKIVKKNNKEIVYYENIGYMCGFINDYGNYKNPIMVCIADDMRSQLFETVYNPNIEELAYQFKSFSELAHENHDVTDLSYFASLYQKNVGKLHIYNNKTHEFEEIIDNELLEEIKKVDNPSRNRIATIEQDEIDSLGYNNTMIYGDAYILVKSEIIIDGERLIYYAIFGFFTGIRVYDANGLCFSSINDSRVYPLKYNAEAKYLAVGFRSRLNTTNIIEKISDTIEANMGKMFFYKSDTNEFIEITDKKFIEKVNALKEKKRNIVNKLIKVGLIEPERDKEKIVKFMTEIQDPGILISDNVDTDYSNNDTNTLHK